MSKHLILIFESIATKKVVILNYLLTNKCNTYRCITQTTTWPLSWWPLRLLANCFLLFCSDLAELIFTMLLDDIKRPIWKSAQGPRGGDIQLFNPFPLYCFTLISDQHTIYNVELKMAGLLWWDRLRSYAALFFPA